MKINKKLLSCTAIAAMISFFPHYDTYASEAYDTPNTTIDVFCPTDYPFLLFDNDAGGRQLTSQIFHIANYSSEDIIVDLAEAAIEPGEGIPFKELSQPVDNNYISDSKDVFAFLKVVDIDSSMPLTPDTLKEIDIPMEEVVPQENDYILTGTKKTTSYQIVLKAANHDENGNFISFNPESIFSFYIAGSTTPDKNLIWNHKDITFRINIKLHTLSEPEEPISEDVPDASTNEPPSPEVSQAEPKDNSPSAESNTETLQPVQDEPEEAPSPLPENTETYTDNDMAAPPDIT